MDTNAPRSITEPAIPKQCPHGNWNALDCSGCKDARTLTLVRLIDERMKAALRTSNMSVPVGASEWPCIRDTIFAALDPAKPTEYICKCGIRVTPHRCPDGTDF